MAKYKLGFIPEHKPYQMEDEYTVELVRQPIGGIPFSNIVYSSPNIRDCIKRKKELENELENELKAKRKKNK